MVAFARHLQAGLTVHAAELVESARRHVHAKVAAVLIGSVTAVEESIALLFGRQTDPARALEVLGLAISVACHRDRRRDRHAETHPKITH